jgi:hypothetical protein
MDSYEQIVRSARLTSMGSADFSAQLVLLRDGGDQHRRRCRTREGVGGMSKRPAQQSIDFDPEQISRGLIQAAFALDISTSDPAAVMPPACSSSRPSSAGSLTCWSRSEEASLRLWRRHQ